MNKILIALVVVCSALYLVQVEGASKCYSCEETEECPHDAAHQQLCTDLSGTNVTDAICYRIYAKEGDKQGYVLGCLPYGTDAKAYCDVAKKAGAECEYCDKDLCNGSSPIATSTMLITLAVAAIMKFLY